MINATWRVMKGLMAFCNFDASMQHRTRASSAGAEPNWTTCMRCRRSMQSQCYPYLDSCELVLAPVCPVLQSLWCHLLAPLMGDLNFGRWNHITKVTKPNVTRSHQLAVLLDTPLTMGSVRLLGLRLAAVLFSSVDIWLPLPERRPQNSRLSVYIHISAGGIWGCAQCAMEQLWTRPKHAEKNVLLRIELSKHPHTSWSFSALLVGRPPAYLGPALEENSLNRRLQTLVCWWVLWKSVKKLSGWVNPHGPQ